MIWNQTNQMKRKIIVINGNSLFDRQPKIPKRNGDEKVNDSNKSNTIYQGNKVYCEQKLDRNAFDFFCW